MRLARLRIVGLVLGLAAAMTSASQPLILLFYDRPPYLQRNHNGEIVGLTASVATKALRKAGIAFVWRELSTNRQLFALRQNTEPMCAVGWFHLAERETWAKYSAPLYRDRPTEAYLRLEISVSTPARLDQVLRKSGLRVLRKDGFTYGAYIDGLLQDKTIKQVTTTSDSIDMLRQVQMGHADLIFTTAEEADWYQQERPHIIAGLQRLPFVDAEPGENRHLMCSRKVTDDQLKKVNDALLPANP